MLAKLKAYLGFMVVGCADGQIWIHFTWSRSEALDWMRCYGCDWTVTMCEARMFGGRRIVAARQPV